MRAHAARTVVRARARSARFACAIAAVAVLAAPAAHAGRTEAARRTQLPRQGVLVQALAAYREAEAAGLVRNRVLTVVDYALPSSQRRLWVLDPDSLRVRFHEFVAHGRGSTTDTDPDRAIRFGNEPGSHRSSLGTFLTRSTYTGKHGHSLELEGLDRGVNDLAYERRIVIHPADYVSADFRAASGGRVGRSFGCPALDPAVARAVIDTIQDGSVLFAAGRDDDIRRAAASQAAAAAGAAAAAAAHGR